MKPESYNERQQWFIDRIGKIVYRNYDGCSCHICHHIYNYGLAIDDKYHAHYLCEIEFSFNADGCPLRYFDTKQEVAEFEKSLNK